MDLDFKLVAARGKHDPSSPWDQPGQNLYLNGEKMAWVPGDLRTVASRPICHELGCSGCPEGYATSVARLQLEKLREEYEVLSAAYEAPGAMHGECCDYECFEMGYESCSTLDKINRMEKELNQ